MLHPPKTMSMLTLWSGWLLQADYFDTLDRNNEIQAEKGRFCFGVGHVLRHLFLPLGGIVPRCSYVWTCVLPCQYSLQVAAPGDVREPLFRAVYPCLSINGKALTSESRQDTFNCQPMCFLPYLPVLPGDHCQFQDAQNMEFLWRPQQRAKKTVCMVAVPIWFPYVLEEHLDVNMAK